MSPTPEFDTVAVAGGSIAGLLAAAAAAPHARRVACSSRSRPAVEHVLRELVSDLPAVEVMDSVDLVSLSGTADRSTAPLSAGMQPMSNPG